jgi:hypothetical protein
MDCWSSVRSGEWGAGGLECARGEHGEERVHSRGVELGAGAAAQLLGGLLRRAGRGVGRALMMASKAAQTAMMRAPRGMS